MSVRVRFAPSPTGELHLGSLRTVLYDYLFARKHEGAFLVRIEDTDQARSVDGSVERLLQGMRWAGIEPDEGVYLDTNGQVAEKGALGPYTQSKRLDIYKKYADQLLENGQAYRCFCTSERLEQMRAEQQANHLPPRYDGRCRGLTKEESTNRASKGEVFVVRQKMPENEVLICPDIIHESLEFNSSTLDDQILIKSDGFPTYQLANVVDDHLMEITHVLRGDEWIPSLPKNILLYQAFGWEPPQYAHLPLILGADKTKLSKRHGAQPVLAYQDMGYLPEAVVNTIAFIGWSPGTEEEFFTMDELIKRFQLEKVQKAPAVFNPERLDYMNGWYVRRLPVGEMVERMLHFWREAGLLKKEGEKESLVNEIALPLGLPEYLLTVAGAVQERLKHFDESVFLTQFFFKRPQVSAEVLVTKKGDLETTKRILAEVTEVLAKISVWRHDPLEEALQLFISQKGYKNGEVLWPIRAALTGEAASPGAYEMLVVLGKEESLIRLNTVEQQA